jgi:hypothetical protein
MFYDFFQNHKHGRRRQVARLPQAFPGSVELTLSEIKRVLYGFKYLRPVGMQHPASDFVASVSVFGGERIH